MAWKLLPVDYTDAVWPGLKRYMEIANEDGSVSFQDVTNYTGKEKSFFGAKDANRMNEALNTIMSMVENGTDLYTAFQAYFTTQKGLFENEAKATQTEFDAYVEGLKSEGDAEIEAIKTDYRNEIDSFEDNQEELFNTWFSFIKEQLTDDVAGNLQNQVNVLDTKTDGFDSRETTFSVDGKTITEVYGAKKIVTEFVSDSKIVQQLYENEVLTLTKTITFSADGKTIKEEVK